MPADPPVPAKAPDLSRNAARAAIGAAAQRYFDARRARVPGFVRRHFGPVGTLRLHRTALGLDILRAPLNVLLSPVFILSRLGGWLAGRLGAQGASRWLLSRRILLPTAVARRVETLIVADLMELPVERGDRDALAEAVLRAPAVRVAVAAEAGEAGLARLQSRVSQTLGDYTGTRSAVAEMTTALGTMGTGAVVFKTLTPGVVSMAPAIAAILAHQAAVAAFPMGAMLGGMWYGWFPASTPVWMSAGTIGVLVLIGATVTAFAGVIADPVQSMLGIHQRRLNRMIDALETEFTGDDPRAFAAREHYLARMMDLADAGVGALRVLRGG